jgi:hypothetical protein
MFDTRTPPRWFPEERWETRSPDDWRGAFCVQPADVEPVEWGDTLLTVALVVSGFALGFYSAWSLWGPGR